MKAAAPLSESWAFAYLRIPFVDRGSGFAGCDCFGLVKLAFYAQRGIVLPDYPEIAPGDNPAKFREIIREAQGPTWQEIPPGEEQPFDVVLMRGIVQVEGRRAGRPIHVGLVVQPGRLIHIEEGPGVTIGDYRHMPGLKNRVISFYRYALEQ
jgi:cell wall-associated NlpC family hydrolase